MKKRLLALLTALCMLLSILPATAFAQTVEPLEPVYISQYNPLYGGFYYYEVSFDHQIFTRDSI